MRNDVRQYNMTRNDLYILGQMTAHGLQSKHDALGLAEALHNHRDKLPFVIWREPSAQHFIGSPRGAYTELASTKNCSAHIAEGMDRLVPASRCISAMMTAAGFPVLDTLSMSNSQWNAHIGYVTSVNKMDCTHWCTPGVVDVWSVVLYNLLMNLGTFPKRAVHDNGQTDIRNVVGEIDACASFAKQLRTPQLNVKTNQTGKVASRKRKRTKSVRKVRQKFQPRKQLKQFLPFLFARQSAHR
eukprot:5803307-Pyramimonas_sp.AAC.1